MSQTFSTPFYKVLELVDGKVLVNLGSVNYNRSLFIFAPILFKKKLAHLDLSMHISNLLSNTEILFFWNPSEQDIADIE